MNRLFALARSVAAVSLLAACGGGGSAPDVGTRPVGEAEVVADVPSTRTYKRMDIDQLEAAIQRATGGIGWTERIAGKDVSLFDHLSGSLGKPEYLARTEEDLLPGLLFQKFLDDAATSACTELVRVEPGRPSDERVLIRPIELADTVIDADGTEEGVRLALRRFHGRMVAPGDPELAPWLTLMSQARDATGDPASSWRALCVALIVHPDFYSY